MGLVSQYAYEIKIYLSGHLAGFLFHRVLAHFKRKKETRLDHITFPRSDGG